MTWIPVKVPKPSGKLVGGGKPRPKTRKPLKKTRMRCGAGSKRRGGHAFPKNVDEPYRAWIRWLPCILAGRMANATFYSRPVHYCFAIVEACHVKTRGSGGKDRNNLYPGCNAAHTEQHAIGIPEFQRRWGVDLKTVARQLTEAYEAEMFPCP